MNGRVNMILTWKEGKRTTVEDPGRPSLLSPSSLNQRSGFRPERYRIIRRCRPFNGVFTWFPLDSYSEVPGQLKCLLG